MKFNELFVGRENELETLLSDFENVKNGNPTIRVLLGETGLGKTRLIQQFYQSIATDLNESTANKYWPDTLKVGKSLSLNPEFDSTQDIQHNMPWFWWAMRGIQPSQRNVSEETPCVLIKSLHHLTPHVKLMQEKSNGHEEQWSFAENSIKVVAALVDLFTTGGVITTGVGLYGTIQDSKAVVDTVRSISNKSNFNHISEYKDNEQKEFTEIIQDFFEKIILAELNVPLVLVVDDAQWIDSDSVVFLEKLYSIALENNLPLYIIATHWSIEWYANKNEENTLSNLCHKNKIDPYIIKPITDNNDVNKILNSYLPGITNLQKGKIINKTSGNFGYLYDLIFYFCADENKDLFVEDNNTKQLNEYGEKELETIITELDHVALIQKRFNQYEESIRKILMWSSFQGEEFFEVLTKEVGERIDNLIDVTEELNKAKVQYNAIESTLENISTFPNRALFEVAFKKLRSRKFDIFTDHFLTVMDDWFDNKRYEQYPVSVETFLLLFKSLSSKKDDKYPLILVELLLNYMNTRQFKKLDSLTKELINIETSVSLNKQILHNVASILYVSSYFNSAISLCSLIIAQSNNHKELFKFYYTRAFIQYNRGEQGDFENSKNDLETVISLIISIDVSIQKNLDAYLYLSNAYNLLGNIYINHNNKESLDNYLESVNILERIITSLSDKDRNEVEIELANVYGNIGLVYEKEAQYSDALEIYEKQSNVYNNVTINLLEDGKQYLFIHYMANVELNTGIAFMHLARAEENSKYYYALASSNFDLCIERLEGLRSILGDLFEQNYSLNLMKAYTYKSECILAFSNQEEAIKTIQNAIKIGEGITHNRTLVIKEALANAYFSVTQFGGGSYQDLEKATILLENIKDSSPNLFTENMDSTLRNTYIAKSRLKLAEIEKKHSDNIKITIQKIIDLKNELPIYDIVSVDTFLGKAYIDYVAHCNTTITKEIETYHTINPTQYNELIGKMDTYSDEGLEILLNLLGSIQRDAVINIKDVFYTSLARAYKFKGIIHYMSENGNKPEAVKYFNMSIESYSYVEDEDEDFYYYLDNVKQLREECLRLI